MPISTFRARMRSLWRGLRHRAEVEAEMREEFLHHLELRSEDLVRRGLPPREAARQARLEFRHAEGHKEDGQDAPGDSDSGPWFEIVGVVSAFTPPPPFERFAPKLYQPLALAAARDRTGRPAPGMACRGRCWRTFQRRDS